MSNTINQAIDGFLQKTPLSNIKPNPSKEKPAEPYTAGEIDID